MAIQKTLILKNNFGTDSQFENAYIKVETVKMDKSFADAHVSIKDQKDGALLKSENHSFAVDLAGANPITQAYNYLKSLPEYQGAMDC